MPDVRYVCLSDLHFGAQNSLLTNLAAGDVIADPLAASPTLTVFVDCLSSLVAANEDRSTKPILVLNGDILDFALASDEVAILAFERFVELALRRPRPLLPSRLLPPWQPRPPSVGDGAGAPVRRLRRQTSARDCARRTLACDEHVRRL